MKNIFKKQNIMPVVVLGSICLIVAVLMAVINSYTAPKIADYEAQKVFESLKVVLDGHFEEVSVPAGAPATVTAMYKVTDDDSGDFKGNVVTVKQKGYAGDILLTIGIDAEGKTTKVVITAQSETHGKNINPLLDRLSAGVTAENVADVEAVSGATVSSTAIKSAIADAFKAVSGIASEPEPEEQLPKTDEEIIDLVKSFVGDGVEVTNVTLDEKNDFVKRVYCLSENKGYVAYVYSINERYNAVDTENLVYIGNDGSIKDIMKLTWSVSEAAPEYGYNPPDEERLNQLYADLEGKNSNNIGEVDLETGATNTSTTLVNTLSEALKVVGNILKNNLPRTESEIKNFASQMVGDNVELTDVTFGKNNDYVKLVYRLSENKGYVAYVYSINERYNAVDTENLVYIGNDGSIKDIMKLTWSVSEAAPEYGYNPPDEERLNQLYAELEGKNSNNIDEVDLKTGATNTSTTLVNTLSEALKVVGELIANDMPTPEDQIKELIAEFIGGDITLTNITVDNMSLVRRLYSVNNDESYVVYVVSISPNYGTVETETLIHISSEGKILDMKKILWKVSDPMPEWGYNPPSEDRVNQLYNEFVGKDYDSVSEVELKTGATSTGERLSACVTDALKKVLNYVENSSAAAKEKALLARMEKLVGNAKGFEKMAIPENADATLKALYKVVGFDGYVAYVVTSTQYVDVETETLVYIKSNGKVGNIDLITWTVGHGVEPGDFAKSFVGKSVKKLENVDLVTSATTTSSNLRNAIVNAIEVIPMNYTPVIIGAVIMALSVVSAVAVIIIRRRIFR